MRAFDHEKLEFYNGQGKSYSTTWHRDIIFFTQIIQKMFWNTIDDLME